MARNQDQFARFCARKVDAEWLCDSHGLAVLVGTQERHIEAPARKLEVVRITTEGSDTRLGRKY